MSYIYNENPEVLYVGMECLRKTFDRKKYGSDVFIECNQKEKCDLHEKLTKTINISQTDLNDSLENIDIYEIFISVPVEKRNKCDMCDIQRVLMEINNIHDDTITRKKTYVDQEKCYCKICSSIILYDPHCVCGIYED